MFFYHIPKCGMRSLLFFFVLLFPLSFLIENALGLDAPHNETNGYGCDTCHDVNSPHPKLMPVGDVAGPTIDDTIFNIRCWSCHNSSGDAPDSPYKTHSSLQTDDDYGQWTVECWVCHSVHTQQQDTEYGTSYGKLIRTRINLANIIGLVKSGFLDVKFTGNTDFSDGDALYNGICEVCHTQTTHFRNNGSGSDQLHANVGGADGTNCTSVCHTHSNGFIHGGGSTTCEACHNSGSHTTHISATNAIGPRISCNSCHDIANMPYFSSGTDGNGDGNIDLTETTICNPCHSPNGAFDGVDDAAYGARTNWTDGVYTGNILTTGKEKWCVSCHDLGTSTIKGRQAPDVAGDNTNYGYYVSGHGSAGAAQECGACHGLDMVHNFDGQQTYAGDLDNYKQGYRLSDVGGMDPLDIPLARGNFGDYRPDAYRLCFSCHDEETLMNDTKSHGCYNDPGNPYKNAAAITTQFRNLHVDGHDTGSVDIPANFHADHLIDVGNTGILWYSDGPGTLSGRSATTCPTCHNPHGDKKSDGTATLAMTAGVYEITRGSDATGEYGEVTSNSYDTAGDPQQRCVVTCHGFGGNTSTRWYYNAVPTLRSISLSDRDNTNPSPAESGFSNELDVHVIPEGYGPPPDTTVDIMCAEDNLFTVNATPWSTYASPFTYTLVAGEGSRDVYCKTRNAVGESTVQSASITVDTINPAMLTTTLSSPNGAEVWTQGTAQNITWTTGDIIDTNLKGSPISLAYSTDSGGTFPNSIALGEVNDGTYAWSPIALIDSNSVQVQLTATDQAGNQSSDTSDGDFIIQLP